MVTKSLMMQDSFTQPTTFLKYLLSAKYLVGAGEKLLKYQKLVLALENFIAIKDGENLKGDILQM